MSKIELNEERQIAEDRARVFIAKHTWKFAKTMPWVPHFYLAKDYLSDLDKSEFQWFIEQSRIYGKMMVWENKPPKPYWFIDEWKYWTMMDDPIEIENILNRAEHHI